MIHRDANGLELGPRHFGDPETDSDSDLGDSSADERARRKARGSQLITAGLATVATIHAAHGVAKSMEARDERHKAVAVGDISHEQARREKNKARLQDAASISIAALGIKGAVSEWKEMKEKRQEALMLKEKQQRHRVKREARRVKMQSMGMQDRYTDSAPTLSPQPSTFSSPGPTYYDDNPYSTGHLPAAPYYPHVASPPPPHGHPPARFWDTHLLISSLFLFLRMMSYALEILYVMFFAHTDAISFGYDVDDDDELGDETAHTQRIHFDWGLFLWQ
jgi:hypothetical protein